MVRIFKTKWFARFARKNGIGDRRLSDAGLEIQGGLHDGDLGGNLVKKRVACEGQGKRGGYRTIAVHRAGDRTIFVYGFPKSAKAGLNPVERDAYQKLAQIYLSFTGADMVEALNAGELEEIDHNGEEISK